MKLFADDTLCIAIVWLQEFVVSESEALCYKQDKTNANAVTSQL